MDIDEKTGVATFYSHDPKNGLMITKTGNKAMIEKLHGVLGKSGKKEKHWRMVLDKDGIPTKEKIPKIKNTKWTDEDGIVHGNDKEYVPIDVPIEQLIREPDESIEEAI